MAAQVCPVCGAAGHTCGPTGIESAVAIFDSDRSAAMSEQPVELKEYTYTDDNGNEVTLRLTEDEAKERGLAGGSKSADEPSNKSRSSKNK